MSFLKSLSQKNVTPVAEGENWLDSSGYNVEISSTVDKWFH